MSDTIQDSINSFKDFIFNTKPSDLKTISFFKYDRDEFIFRLNDKTTLLVFSSKFKASIRSNNEVLINMVYDSNWSIKKYDDTILSDESEEVVWLKNTLDNLLLTMTDKINRNNKKVSTEYSSLIQKIQNGKV